MGRCRKSDVKVTFSSGHQVWKNANLHRKCKNRKTKKIASFQINIRKGLFSWKCNFCPGRQICVFKSPNLFFLCFKKLRFCENKECQDTFFIGLPLPKLVTFLIVTIFKYNQLLRTMGEHFGGHMKSYMLMTTKFGVFFVNMNFNLVILLLYQKLIFLVGNISWMES